MFKDTTLDMKENNKINLQYILSDKVIVQCMVQHLTPCSWLYLYSICKCKTWFNKEKTLLEVTKRCLRENLSLVFNHDEHIIEETMKLLGDPNYAFVGDFLLRTLQGEPITSDCELIILTKESYCSCPYREELVNSKICDLILLGTEAPERFRINSFRGCYVQDMIGIKINYRYMLRLQTDYKDFDKYLLLFDLAFTQNILSNNTLEIKDPDSLLTKHDSCFFVDAFMILDVDFSWFEKDPEYCFLTGFIAQYIETEIIKYVDRGYKIALCSETQVEPLSRFLTRALINRHSCFLYVGEECETTNKVEYERLLLQYEQKKSEVWNHYWRKRRSVIGGGGMCEMKMVLDESE